MARCGAVTRGGSACQKPPLKGKNRCALHGGKSTGPKNPAKPIGNQNARTHGIYSDALADDEKGLWDQVEVGNLDNAIKIAHLQLRRALIAQNKAEGGDGLDLDLESINTLMPGSEEVDQDGDPMQPRQTTTVQRRRRPYEDIINRLLGRIGDLEAKRAEIINKAGHTDDMTALLSDLIEKLPS